MINTKHLFYELLGVADRVKYKPKFCLCEQDIERGGKTYKSLYKLFMESIDEYDFATNHLGNLPTWQQLCSTKWFSEGYREHRGIEAWREDLRMRDESNAKKTLMLAASEGDVSAARKLWDMSRPEKETKRGRFKKDEVTKEAAKAVEENDFLSDAAMRLNVVSIRD